MPATKYPEKLGTCVNQLSRLDLRIKKQEAELNKLKKERAEYKDHLIKTFTKDQLNSVKGKDCLVSITRTEVPVIEDWDAFFAYARRKGNHDLLRHAVSTPAWRERLADEKHVPGVGSYTRVGLQIRHR